MYLISNLKISQGSGSFCHAFLRKDEIKMIIQSGKCLNLFPSLKGSIGLFVILIDFLILVKLWL